MVSASSVGQVWRDLGATGSPGGSTGALWGQALAVLAGNSQGTWTRPSPRLYPHQWSWDAAFIAIGLGWADPDRAVSELRSLLRGQWTSGLIPHIVFDADYFVCRIFLEEPSMARQILIQVFAFARKAETDFLRENTCRPAANPDIRSTTTRKDAVVQQQNL